MKLEAFDTAWQERSLALEGQVRVTLLDVEGELCRGHGTAGAAHQGHKGGWHRDIPDGGI